MNNPLLKVSLKWALIYTGVSCITLFGTYLFGMSSNPIIGLILGILSLTITVILLVLSNREYRTLYLDGYIKYYQCLMNNILIFLIGSLIVSLISYVLYGLVDINAFNESIERQLLMISSNPDIPAEWKQKQIDAIIDLTPLKQSIIQFIWSVGFGVFVSLIVSIFTRKKNNSFEGAIKEIE
jgi:hypothetical protein